MVLDTGRRHGESKMRLTRTGLGYFALFLQKQRWQRMAAARRAVPTGGQPLELGPPGDG